MSGEGGRLSGAISCARNECLDTLSSKMRTALRAKPPVIPLNPIAQGPEPGPHMNNIFGGLGGVGVDRSSGVGRFGWGWGGGVGWDV